MINNIQNLFIKYSINKTSKSQILDILIIFFKEEIGVDFKKDEIKIDLKNKIIFLNKNTSSFKFFLKSYLTDEKKNNLEKKIDFKINF